MQIAEAWAHAHPHFRASREDRTYLTLKMGASLLLAIRRAGQLLEQIDGRQGQNLPTAKTDATDSFSQRDAAREAGMSERQQVTAVPREIWRIPTTVFRGDQLNSQT